MSRSTRPAWAVFHAGEIVRCGAPVTRPGRQPTRCNRGLAKVGRGAAVLTRPIGPERHTDAPEYPVAYVQCPRCDSILELRTVPAAEAAEEVNQEQVA